jgi:ABC-type nitrate/sulfonate/bicarbonate transport system permease component
MSEAHASFAANNIACVAHGRPQLRPARTSYVARILIAAAFGSILTGLKIGWAIAWCTSIAAELVFGVSSGLGGLGWFI